MAFGPAGSRFLTVQDSGEVWLWAERKAVGMLKLAGVPLSASFSPDASRILTKNEAAALEAWDVAAVDFHGTGAAQPVNQRHRGQAVADGRHQGEG
jgi:hypothetical protein